MRAVVQAFIRCKNRRRLKLDTLHIKVQIKMFWQISFFLYAASEEHVTRLFLHVLHWFMLYCCQSLTKHTVWHYGIRSIDRCLKTPINSNSGKSAMFDNALNNLQTRVKWTFFSVRFTVFLESFLALFINHQVLTAIIV